MALCSLLAFWTGGDTHQIDRLFRDSGLYREKWDEVHFSDGATYGERTIERAIAGTQEFYGEGQQWSLFPEQPSPAATDSSDPTTAQQPESVDVHTIETLEAEIRRLEAENERLSEELAAEREQREMLAAELAEREERSLFNWLRR
jgi:primase-polymerase (primpol)-like protein